MLSNDEKVHNFAVGYSHSFFKSFMKRLLDLVIVILGGSFALPLLALIIILIRSGSTGSIFFGHTRIGENGKKFKMWKFRTMFQNADQMLEEYLNKFPEIREEWKAGHKLKNDPRVTRVGIGLRESSLDELPQLWNVLKGEMSIVGPRPIVDDEINYYAEKFDYYKRVKPGITGWWQVNGRNDTTYEERVGLDEYYVRNWSIWLDVYILIKTVWVVLRREGAY